MDFSNLIAVIQQYLDPAMMIVVVVLWVLGFFLKKSPKVADWAIIWILSVLAIVAAIALFGFTIKAFIQGILAAGIAVYAHQLIKQTTIKRLTDDESNV